MSQIVFVHGAGLDSQSWANQTRFFAESVAVDLPGHGRSTAASMSSVADYSSWLGSEIRTVGPGPVALVGHSLGSLIALETAAKNPDFIDHLVLIATAATMPVNRDLMASARAHDPGAATTILKWSLTRPAYGRAKGWLRTLEQAFVDAAESGVLADDLTACDSYRNALEQAAEVRCPVLLILGERDVMTKPQAANPLAAALADARIVMIEGAGHMLPLENAAAVNDSIALFLGIA